MERGREGGGERRRSGCAALPPLQPPAWDPGLRLGGVRVAWTPTAVTGEARALPASPPHDAAARSAKLRPEESGLGPCGCERRMESR